MAEAVVKDWMARAVKPLLKEAKHIFRPEAAPMVGERWLVFRTWASCGPEGEAEARVWGPERGMLGRVQVAEESSFWVGGGPIMPPSRKRIVPGLGWKRSSILRAEAGLIAFRSR